MVRDEELKKITDVVHKAVVVDVSLADDSNSEEVFVHGQLGESVCACTYVYICACVSLHVHLCGKY